MSIELIKGTLMLCVPLITAVIATYIAYQQWRTSHRKLELDLYDRRLRIYEQVKRILSLITRDAYASDDDLLKFRTSVSEADFLFEPEIMVYIDEIYDHGLKLWAHRASHEANRQDPMEGYDRQANAKAMGNELKWLVSQHGPAKDLFGRYLAVGGKRQHGRAKK